MMTKKGQRVARRTMFAREKAKRSIMRPVKGGCGLSSYEETHTIGFEMIK